MKPRTKHVLLCAALMLALPPLGFFTTARYGGDGAGVHFISRPPLLTISWGPRQRFIVLDGLNFVPDRAPRAQAGNFAEFTLPFSDSRVSLRMFSWSWADYEYEGWKSDHRHVAASTP